MKDIVSIYGDMPVTVFWLALMVVLAIIVLCAIGALFHVLTNWGDYFTTPDFHELDPAHIPSAGFPPNVTDSCAMAGCLNAACEDGQGRQCTTSCKLTEHITRGGVIGG